MLYWIPYAFVRISVFFIAGILLSIYAPQVPISWAIGILVFLVVVYFAIFFLNRARNQRILNPGFIGLLAVLVAGYVNLYFRTDSNRAEHISKTGKIYYYEATIGRFGQEKEKQWKEVVSIERVFDGERWKVSSGNVLLYLSRKDFPNPFRYGDRFLIRGFPQPVPGPSNPGEFDYRRFLANKNIYHQQFINRANILLIGHEPPSALMDVSVSMRRWADGELREVIGGRKEQAIASALVLGITDGLDNDLMGAYAATGALHVLSVSGLHVGILYLLMMLLLKPLLKLKHGKWVVAGISLLILWIYACVTGLSPSVLRAVTMFSFMVVAKPLGQRTNIYNVLTASAFCLLLVDPYLILSVGFQLSYMAVLGIVYLQPLLYNAFEPNSRIVDEIWKVTSVSIAAQLATFSLGLLYFHQFPNYFLISNLYVLPLGFVILVGGLAVLAVSAIAPLAAFLGNVLEWTIKLLNYLIEFTEALPFSVISGIQISLVQCILLTFFVTALVLFVRHRQLWMLRAGTFCVLTFSIISWVKYFDHLNQSQLTVYKVAGASCYDLTSAGTAYHFNSGPLDSEKTSYHIHPNRLHHHVETIQDGSSLAFSREFKFGRVISWKGITVLQLTARPEELDETIHVDYLIISQNAIRSLDEIPATILASNVILDSSNSFRLAEKLMQQNQKKNIPIHSVWHQGAFDKTI
jgi:competence protein ComEC